MVRFFFHGSFVTNWKNSDLTSNLSPVFFPPGWQHYVTRQLPNVVTKTMVVFWGVLKVVVWKTTNISSPSGFPVPLCLPQIFGDLHATNMLLKVIWKGHQDQILCNGYLVWSLWQILLDNYWSQRMVWRIEKNSSDFFPGGCGWVRNNWKPIRVKGQSLDWHVITV